MPNFRGSSAAVHGLMILAISAVAVRAANAQHFPPDEDLKTMLRYLVEDGETPGIVLGILEADGTTRILWHGSAGKDAKRPYHPGRYVQPNAVRQPPIPVRVVRHDDGDTTPLHRSPPQTRPARRKRRDERDPIRHRPI